MYSHSTQIRVRYGETDQMGYVYHGNYAQYYEIGRTEMLRSMGMDYVSMENSGVMMPVLDLSVKYIKPALYDQLITIKTILQTLPGVRIHFQYELFNEQDELINTGSTTLVFFDRIRKRPCPAPIEFMERLKNYFN